VFYVWKKNIAAGTILDMQVKPMQVQV